MHSVAADTPSIESPKLGFGERRVPLNTKIVQREVVNRFRAVNYFDIVKLQARQPRQARNHVEARDQSYPVYLDARDAEISSNSNNVDLNHLTDAESLQVWHLGQSKLPCAEGPQPQSANPGPERGQLHFIGMF
jgi:hypothetical protein